MVGTSFLNPNWDLHDDWLVFYDMLPVEIPSLNVEKSIKEDEDEEFFKEHGVRKEKEPEKPKPRIYAYLEHLDLFGYNN